MGKKVSDGTEQKPPGCWFHKGVISHENYELVILVVPYNTPTVGIFFKQDYIMLQHMLVIIIIFGLNYSMYCVTMHYELL